MMDVGELGLRDAALAGWYLDETSELVRDMPVGPDAVVVDVGCGPGFASQFCARQGARVLAVDRDPTVARAMRFTLRGVGADDSCAVLGDAGALPLADGMATHVVCTEVLQHVDDPARVLRELVRVGNARALYLVSVPGIRQAELLDQVLPPELSALPDAKRVIAPNALRDMLAGAGLVVLREFDHGFFWSIWWALSAACETGMDAPEQPVLAHWAATWEALLALPQGRALKQRLDAFMPVSHAVLARKA